MGRIERASTTPSATRGWRRVGTVEDLVGGGGGGGRRVREGGVVLAGEI